MIRRGHGVIDKPVVGPLLLLPVSSKPLKLLKGAVWVALGKQHPELEHAVMSAEMRE